MSKRGCPWSDGTPQRKTCVKEETSGGETQRKAVYERTRALLFSGASSTHQAPAPPASPCTPPRRGAARGGQMRLGARGELLRSPNSTDESFTSVCTLCERPLFSSAACGRCEKVVCLQCQRQCHLCLRVHCFICCQPNYSERYERIFCIDCLPQ